MDDLLQRLDRAREVRRAEIDIVRARERVREEAQPVQRREGHDGGMRIMGERRDRGEDVG